MGGILSPIPTSPGLGTMILLGGCSNALQHDGVGVAGGAGGREEDAHPSSRPGGTRAAGKTRVPLMRPEEEAASVWGSPAMGHEVQGAGKDLQSRWEMRTGGGAGDSDPVTPTDGTAGGLRRLAAVTLR